MRNRRIRESSADGHSRDRWLISYADLITLLLGLFIVLYAASDRERAQMIARSFADAAGNGTGILDGGVSRTDEANRQFVEAVAQNSLLLQKTKVTRSNDGLIISLSEAGFFAPGDSIISQESDDVIVSIAEQLRSNSTQVRIEGHTDSTPISNARYPSNWELSTARAASVLSRLIEKGVAPERLSAAGYAGFRPVQDNTTADGRAQNRRVDIVILDR